MRDNISPEEKLLRLIRNPRKHDPLFQKPALNSPSDNTVYTKAQPKTTAIKNAGFDFKSFLSAKKAVYLFLILSAGYAIFSFVYPFVGYRKLLPEMLSSEDSDEQVIQTKPNVKPYEEYLKGLDDRKIFDSSALPGSSPATSAAATQDLIKDINLVGIISGENPQVIIEDKKTQKTYYLFQGQYFGEFQIEEIKEGKVTINYRGQRFELYL